MSAYDMLDYEALCDLIGEKCIRFGDFKLNSGAHTDWQVNLQNILMDPEGTNLLGRELYKSITGHFPTARQLAGVSIDGMMLVANVVRLSNDQPVSLYGFGAQAALNGESLIGETFDPARPTVLVQDVTSDGEASLAAADVIQKAGGNLLGILSVVDRGEGAQAAYAARGIPFISLYGRANFAFYEPDIS